jgi:hypothetical protein
MSSKPGQIQVGTAILFLLQREFVRECKIEPAVDENGDPQLDPNGQPMDRAVHPMGWSFEMWLKNNKIVMEQPSIIQQATPPLQIVK